MSFIGDLLFGEDPTGASVEDVRSPLQIEQQQQILTMLQGFAGEGGLPTFGGETTAQIGAGEQGILDQILALTQGGFPSLTSARGALTDISGGGATSPQLDQLIQLISGPAGVNPIISDIGNNPEDSTAIFQQVRDLLSGASADPNDPRLLAMIQAATRPILDQFEQQGMIDRNLFTQAGQFVQPGSSSPFELAKSRRDVGLANALGDVGSRLTFDNLNAERERQFGLVDTLSRGFENQQGRQVDLSRIVSDAFQGGESRRLTAAAQTAPFEQVQLEGLLSALDASALPRLVEQFGLTEGQDQFEGQQQSLLKILQLLVTGNQPEIVTLPGSPGSSGLIGPLVGAAATAFGGPIGAAAAAALLN